MQDYLGLLFALGLLLSGGVLLYGGLSLEGGSGQSVEILGGAFLVSLASTALWFVIRGWQARREHERKYRKHQKIMANKDDKDDDRIASGS